MWRARMTWLSACAVLLSGVVLAASFPGEVGLRERTQLAHRVVIAQILERRVDQSEGTPPRLRTLTTLGVREYLKGDGPRTLKLVQLGGRSGAWSSGVVGDASFDPGETVLAFLRCAEADATSCSLVGLGLGKVAIRAVDGKLQAWVPQPDRAAPVEQPLERVVDEVRRAVRGEPAGLPAPEPSSPLVSAPALAPTAVQPRVFTPRVPVPTGQPRTGAAR